MTSRFAAAPVCSTCRSSLPPSSRSCCLHGQCGGTGILERSGSGGQAASWLCSPCPGLAHGRDLAPAGCKAKTILYPQFLSDWHFVADTLHEEIHAKIVPVRNTDPMTLSTLVRRMARNVSSNLRIDGCSPCLKISFGRSCGQGVLRKGVEQRPAGRSHYEA